MKSYENQGEIKLKNYDLECRGELYRAHQDKIRLKKKRMNVKQDPIQRGKLFLSRVVYFGWPNQPSSGTMENLHWKREKKGGTFSF